MDRIDLDDAYEELHDILHDEIEEALEGSVALIQLAEWYGEGRLKLSKDERTDLIKKVESVMNDLEGALGTLGELPEGDDSDDEDED